MSFDSNPTDDVSGDPWWFVSNNTTKYLLIPYSSLELKCHGNKNTRAQN